MKNLKQTKFLCYSLLIAIFLFSCSTDNELGNTSMSNQNNFVELSKVKEIADNISFPASNKGLNAKGVKSSKRTPNSIEEIKNNGKTVFYVISYSEGGFILISADYRIPPILGFSVDNYFNTNEALYPAGLKYWINWVKSQISDIQNSNIVQSNNEKIAWDKVQSALIEKIASSRVPPDTCYEHTDIYTKGPLLSSLWYQTDDFNAALPLQNCYGSTNHILAGCEPIAMAQVMKYYQFPSNYNWSAMPLNYATSTTADFIKDIHDAISAVYGSGQPYYDCDGTYVNLNLDMGSVLKTQFNYTSAVWDNYDRNIVKNNLELNRPVILSGNNGGSTNGHMWVCDGYRITTFYSSDCTGVGYFELHMNWGWGGANNGWYIADFYNSINTPYFNQNLKMIFNIIP